LLKRKIIFGDYNTAVHGWTLTGWNLSPAEEKTNFMDKVGGDGSWDLSTALTDGIPRYKDRQLTATFECSEGTRMEREAIIRQMVNRLDGMREDIYLPDDLSHHINGKLHVVRNYNDLAHASVTVTAICGPWKHSNGAKALTLTATDALQRATLINEGRRAVVPTLKVEGVVVLEYAGAQIELTAGEYQWPELLLTPGHHWVKYSGAGQIIVVYREAVLE
jgi:hypothetical protein